MPWNQIKRYPVFIGGHRKCGTTLLVSLLDGHPDLFVYPGETGFFYKYFPLYEKRSYNHKEKEAHIISSILRELDSDVRCWMKEGDCSAFTLSKAASVFRNKIRTTPRKTKDYFESIISTAYALLPDARDKKPKAWVEKTTSIEIYASTLFAWYPQARFIHLVRDPRDNYGAIKAGWEREYSRYFDSKERLLQSVMDRGRLGMEFAKLNLKRFGAHRYLIVRYEDLVAEPRKELSRISSFLSIPFCDSLLKPTFGGVLWKGNSFGKKAFSSISKNHLNRWRERITGHEAKVLEYYFAPLLKEFGYAITYTARERQDAAVEHYKWFNYAQVYSLKVPAPKQKSGSRDRA